MKFTKFTTLSAAISVAVGLTAPAHAAEIIYSSFAHQDAISTRGNVWFLEEVEKRTDGKFSIKEKFYNGALLKGGDALSGIGSGIADAGYLCTGYFVEKLPLTSVAEFLYMTEKGDAVARAMNELYESHEPLRDEFEAQNLALLGTESPSPFMIALSTDKRIESATDLEGIKVRAFGTTSEALKLGGGLVPVFVDISEIGTAMQTGLIEGYSSLPLWYPAAGNFMEQTKTIVAPRAGTYYACHLVMNLDTFNSLDEDVKEVIREVRAEYPAKSMEMTAEGDQVTIEEGKELGVDFYKFTDEEVEMWKENMSFDALRAEWIAARQSKTDADVQAFYDNLLTRIREYEPDSTYFQDFPE